MTAKSIVPIDNLLTQRCAGISKEWLSDVMLVWNRHYPGLVDDDELRRHADRLLDELMISFAAHLGDTAPDLAAEGALLATARKLGDYRAKAGFKPTETAKYALAMNNVLTGRLLSELSPSSSHWVDCMTRVDEMLERTPLLTFEVYERSLSLIDLYTPIIRLWDQVLMVPLVGVIDPLRARQFAKCLLEAITLYGATVAIMDVTGVPVFAPLVARQFRKAVNAAQELGTHIILTGIGAEDVLTLTSAGISFARVQTRETLRAGFEEALQVQGFGPARRIRSASIKCPSVKNPFFMV